jgi:hypothetical protein
MPDVKVENPEFIFQNPENSGIYFSKSGKNPERFSRIILVTLRSSF